jgi:hypothetical protein
MLTECKMLDNRKLSKWRSKRRLLVQVIYGRTRLQYPRNLNLIREMMLIDQALPVLKVMAISQLEQMLLAEVTE